MKRLFDQEAKVKKRREPCDKGGLVKKESTAHESPEVRAHRRLKGLKGFQHFHGVDVIGE